FLKYFMCPVVRTSGQRCELSDARQSSFFFVIANRFVVHFRNIRLCLFAPLFVCLFVCVFAVCSRCGLFVRLFSALFVRLPVRLLAVRLFVRRCLFSFILFVRTVRLFDCLPLFTVCLLA